MGNKFQIVWRLLVVVFLALLPVSPVLASDTTTVTINMKFTVGVQNLVITYVSDTDMHLSWSYDPTLYENVMIRSSYVGYPADITDPSTAPSDGNLVYYGSGTTFDDTSMDFNQNTGPIYYKAWAQRADGTWEIATSTGSEESRVVLFIAFVVIVLVFTIVAFLIKRAVIAGMLRLVAAILWVIMIPVISAQSWPTTNTYLIPALQLFCGVMLIIMVITTAMAFFDWNGERASSRPHEPTDEEFQASYARQVRKLTSKRKNGRVRWD